MRPSADLPLFDKRAAQRTNRLAEAVASQKAAMMRLRAKRGW